jgi:hypothetical protein
MKKEDIMKHKSNIIEPIRCFLILNLILLGIIAPVNSEAHYSDTVLSGFGTAAIDGVMSPGEWDGAGRIDYLANVPTHDGGGTTPVTLFVMNDETSLYIALRILRVSFGGATNPIFEFDNNHNGVWPEEGDDGFGMAVGIYSPATFFDVFRTSQPPCPSGSICGLLDGDFGGTNDGTTAASNDGQFTHIEFSHPLNSNDDLHDFSISLGDSIGFHHSLRLFSVDPLCNYGPDCYADTEFPPWPFFGDIAITEQPAVKATIRIKPESLNIKSKGVFTAFITLPEDYNVEDIDINTIECEGASAIRTRKRHDTLAAKFNKEDLVGVETGHHVTLEVTGYLKNGILFSGTDTIKVIRKGKK